MANAASGVATTTAGDAGCQVSPTLQRAGTKQHGVCFSRQQPVVRVIFIFLKKKEGTEKRLEGNRPKWEPCFSLGEETVGDVRVLYCVRVFCLA